MEKNWDDIAQFIVHGVIPKKEDSSVHVDGQVCWVKSLGYMPWLVWIAIVAVVIALVVGIGLLPLGPVGMTLTYIVYSWLLWTVLTCV